MDGNTASHITYDIELTLPKEDKQYYFDLEAKFDFLVSDISLSLFSKVTPKSGDDQYIMLAQSVGFQALQ
jgi:hypothetical protein